MMQARRWNGRRFARSGPREATQIRRLILLLFVRKLYKM